MERNTQKVLEMVKEMQERVPAIASTRPGRLAATYVNMCGGYTANSPSRNQNAHKALEEITHGASIRLWEIAREKGRMEQLAKAFLCIAPTIIDGGALPEKEKISLPS